MTCDCELPIFFTEKVVVARKQHKCCECRHLIHPGDSHRVISGKWDGEMNTFRQCVRCTRVVDALLREDILPCYGEMREALRERMRDRHPPVFDTAWCHHQKKDP